MYMHPIVKKNSHDPYLKMRNYVQYMYIPITPSPFPLCSTPGIATSNHQNFLFVEMRHEAFPKPDFLHGSHTVSMTFD